MTSNRKVLVFNCDEGIDFQSMGRIFIGLVKVGYSSLRRTRTGVRLVEYMLGNTRVQYLVVWAYSGRNPGILRVSEVPEHQTWLFGVHTQVHTRAPSGCRRYSSTKPGCLGHTRVGIRVPSGCQRYSGIGGTRMPNLVVWIILGEVSGYSQRISY